MTTHAAIQASDSGLIPEQTATGRRGTARSFVAQCKLIGNEKKPGEMSALNVSISLQATPTSPARFALLTARECGWHSHNRSYRNSATRRSHDCLITSGTERLLKWQS
jgi:hypothetical protein